ncbi:MAG: hypothetical protein NE334_21465 [Lentisphaeraceae bacterium]|nr:hypothetical protein [Lentisphaeraceae bacterium]
MSELELHELKVLDGDLREGPNRIDFKETDLLLYGNMNYSSPWNDLDSWRNSQLSFENYCHSYFSLKKENTTRLFGGRWNELIHYLKSYRGKNLVLYFSSHVTSDGYVVLENGRKVSLKLLSAVLNEAQYKVLVIFDTCYAGLLSEQVKSKNVSLFLGSQKNELAYEVRLKGDKPTLNSKFHRLRHFQKYVYENDSKSYSLLGALLLDGLLRSKGNTLKQVFEDVSRQSLEVKSVAGLSYYSKISSVNLSE